MQKPIGHFIEGRERVNWLLAPTERALSQTSSPISCTPVGELQKERMLQIAEASFQLMNLDCFLN